MTMWKPDADQALSDAIAEQVDVPVMVTGFVLVAQMIDGEGGNHVVVQAAPGQRSTTTLGLLAYGDAIERDHVVAGNDE